MGLVKPLVNSQLYHYPPVAAEAVSRQLGAGAHSDWGMITMLLQDDVGGLEVQMEGDGWMSVPPVPNSLIINLGEMMPILTNGLYKARRHRVISNTSGKDRYSAPTFFDPDYFYKIACAPTCLPASGKPDFAPATVGEHITSMYRKAYGLPA